MTIAFNQINEFLLAKGVSATDPSARALVKTELNAADEILEEFFGYGPIASLMVDSSITEILIRGHDHIWIEREGKLLKQNLCFQSEDTLRKLVRRILAFQGKKVDHLSPFADCILPDGSRVHVAISPISRMGTSVSIRKFRNTPWTLEMLRTTGCFGAKTQEYLEKIIAEHKNIFISGGTGTGKTSLLSALLGVVPSEERVLVLEDVAEIKSEHLNTVNLEGRPANQEGEGELSLRRLLKESLRMRPDRLVIGECRGSEALDLLMALNTGHKGSFGTIHANSPRDALQRLELLALLSAENTNESAIKMLIHSAINIVIQLERKDGARRISSICEVRGMDQGMFLMKEISLD